MLSHSTKAHPVHAMDEVVSLVHKTIFPYVEKLAETYD